MSSENTVRSACFFPADVTDLLPADFADPSENFAEPSAQSACVWRGQREKCYRVFFPQISQDLLTTDFADLSEKFAESSAQSACVWRDQREKCYRVFSRRSVR